MPDSFSMPGFKRVRRHSKTAAPLPRLMPGLKHLSLPVTWDEVSAHRIAVTVRIRRTTEI